MIIKRGNSSDLERIQKLNKDIFKRFWENPYSLEDYCRKLQAKKKPLILLAEEKQLIADLIAFERRGSFYIWLLAVKQESRRNGVGGKLLESAEDFGRKWGLDSTSAKVYNVSREMQGLLIRRGYRIVGIEKDSDNRYNSLQFELPS